MSPSPNKVSESTSSMLICNFCGRTILAGYHRHWDGESYCETCVSTYAPYLLTKQNEPFRETLSADGPIGFGKTYLATLAAALVVLLCIFGIPLLLIAAPAFTVVLFLLFAFAFVSIFSLITYVLGFERARACLPRNITIDAGKLIIESPTEVVQYSLQDCDWYVGRSCEDQFGWLLPQSRAIVIRLPLYKVAIGLDDERFAILLSFLGMSRIPMKVRIAKIKLLFGIVSGIAAGAIVGAAIGLLVQLVGLPHIVVYFTALIGAGDGLMVAIVWFASHLTTRAWCQDARFPALVAIKFAAIGFLVGRGMGWTFAFWACTANCIIGYTIVSLPWIRRRLDSWDTAHY